VVQFGLVTKLQEAEVGGQGLGAAESGAGGRTAEHLAEVGTGVGGPHLPQRPAEPGADLLEVAQVAADGAVGQAGGGAGQDEPRQDVGLQRGQLLGADRCAELS
jgi:hypothetical protein